MAKALFRVNTLVYGLRVTERLTKSDWIAHGMRTLASDGAAGLKVGSMATGLRVSRGSFYWHFEDIADFRSQLLKSWQERTTDQVIRTLETEAGPERLKQLLTRAFDRRPSADRAIRSWAAEDVEVAAIVASVDARRIAYIADLIVAAGVERPRALRRATLLYWAWLGQTLVMDARHASLADVDMGDICDLFES
jgi:AcrR family transcriptional regulator